MNGARMLELEMFSLTNLTINRADANPFTKGLIALRVKALILNIHFLSVW